MAEINAFLYAVHPKTVIKNVPYVGFIFRSGSFMLTKEAVELCMKSGSVYRRFGPDHSEKVTTENIDRLHNAEFISIEDWNYWNNTKAEEPVSDNKEEEKREEDLSPVTDESTNEVTVDNDTSENESEVTVESTNEEEATTPITTEVIEEDASSNDVAESTVESSVTDTEEEVIKEEPTIIDPLAEYENDQSNQSQKPLNINYNGNKKKHNR